MRSISRETSYARHRSLGFRLGHVTKPGTPIKQGVGSCSGGCIGDWFEALVVLVE